MPEKFRFLFLPTSIQENILSYSTAKEIFHPIMKINNHFNNLANQPTLFTTIFFNHIKLSTCTALFNLYKSLNSRERKAFAKECIYTTTEQLELFSHYTDGGVDQDSLTYFISNIYKESPTHLYSSKKGENVNVKSLLSDGLYQKYTIDEIAKYAQKDSNNASPLVYKIPYLHESAIHDPQFLSTFGIIKYYDLSRTHPTYNCLLSVWALFVSLDEIDPHCDIVELFNGINTIEKAKAFGFDTTMLVEGATATVMEFLLHSLKKVEKILQMHRGKNARLNGVYPLLFGVVTKQNPNYLNVVQRIGFRHCLLKLIDSAKEMEGGNIDCYNISVSGTIVRLKHNTEE